MKPMADARTDTRLLEREHELGVVGDALGRLLDGHGSMVLIEGPPGIGKTTLLAAGTELGRPRTTLVLEARAGQLEREMPFGVARQLLEPPIERADAGERSRLLAGSAALSLTAFGLEGSTGPNTEVDPFAPIHGLYWLLANLCDSQPVQIVIDDAQWADTQSLRWLDFVARRVTDTPVLILVAARTGEADEPPELGPLRLDATDVLRPSPLSGAGVEELIAAEFGGWPTDQFSAACNRATGGNPFLLTEVVRNLRTRSVGPDAEAAGEVASLATEPVVHSVRGRLEPFGRPAPRWPTRSRCSAGPRSYGMRRAWPGSARTVLGSSATGFAAPRSWRPGTRSISFIRWFGRRSMASCPRSAGCRRPSAGRRADQLDRRRPPRGRAPPHGMRAQRRPMGCRAATGCRSRGDGRGSARRRAALSGAGAGGARAGGRRADL